MSLRLHYNTVVEVPAGTHAKHELQLHEPGTPLRQDTTETYNITCAPAAKNATAKNATKKAAASGSTSPNNNGSASVEEGSGGADDDDETVTCVEGEVLYERPRYYGYGPMPGHYGRAFLKNK